MEKIHTGANAFIKNTDLNRLKQNFRILQIFKLLIIIKYLKIYLITYFHVLENVLFIPPYNIL